MPGIVRRLEMRDGTRLGMLRLRIFAVKCMSITSHSLPAWGASMRVTSRWQALLLPIALAMSLRRVS